jgi:ureidoglycolate hydrolase
MNLNLKKYISDIAFVVIVASAIAFVGWLTHKAINKCEAQAVNYQQVRECINL